MGYLEDFGNVVYKTRSARFTAYHRMKRNRDASKVAEAMCSASIIAISLIGLQCKTIDLANKMSVLTIIMSTFLLVLSLLFSGLDYNGRMKNYHACGNDLNRLYRKIHHDANVLSDVEQHEKELEYLKYYEDILDKYNLNHATFDYQYAIAMMKDADTSPIKSLWLQIRYYIIDVYILYWLIAILPILAIAVYFVEHLYLKQ